MNQDVIRARAEATDAISKLAEERGKWTEERQKFQEEKNCWVNDRNKLKEMINQQSSMIDRLDDSIRAAYEDIELLQQSKIVDPQQLVQYQQPSTERLVILELDADGSDNDDQIEEVPVTGRAQQEEEIIELDADD